MDNTTKSSVEVSTTVPTSELNNLGAIKRIAVLTSGGDAPGMNAAIRAVVRAGISAGLEVYGIRDGFLGLHKDRISRLDCASVNDIINRGGTILGTARFEAFKEESIRAEAIVNLQKRDINALAVIGGDGSYTAALRLTEMGYPCIGIPGTIDNDIHGTDFTIGFDTALNTITECMDRLRDTCNSHKRVSVIEIMGRHCGDLALFSGIAGGAEFTIFPEAEFNKEELFSRISRAFSSGKRHGLVALSENMVAPQALASEIELATGIECRAITLGHLQRGGVPTAMDRILASRLGDYAVKLLLEGRGGLSVGIEKGELVAHPISENARKSVHYFTSEMTGLEQRIA